jgi:hypothetical protein
MIFIGPWWQFRTHPPPPSRAIPAVERLRPCAYDRAERGIRLPSMKILKVLAPLAIAAMAVTGAVAIAQQGGNSSAPSAGIAGQREESNSLEIAPQPAAKPQRPAVQEIPAEKSYEPGEDTDSINQRTDLENDLHNQPNRRTCLGVQAHYASQCYLGKEEQGLLVTGIDPGGPAQVAGVHAQPETGPGRAALATMAALVGPLGLVVDKALEQPGGDLIVAVDDRRVRSKQDLDDVLDRLKPGDTTYLTVIRPTDTHGNHQTLKIKVQVGQDTEASGQCARTYFARSSRPTDSLSAGN